MSVLRGQSPCLLHSSPQCVSLPECSAGHPATPGSCLQSSVPHPEDTGTLSLQSFLLQATPVDGQIRPGLPSVLGDPGLGTHRASVARASWLPPGSGAQLGSRFYLKYIRYCGFLFSGSEVRLVPLTLALFLLLAGREGWCPGPRLGWHCPQGAGPSQEMHRRQPMAADWALPLCPLALLSLQVPLETWYVPVPPSGAQLEGQGRDPGLGWGLQAQKV